ncbi:MAG TPA: nuclear transport factor 2 family protein, partial [Gaiellaceae bacterium]|nr:nuclear transport factor 2 family protein [Gaiellaceae bacterium]
NDRAPTPVCGTHTPRISTVPDSPSSELLARRWFAAVTRGAFDELAEFLHEDVELVSKIRAGAVVHGREDVRSFITEAVTPNLYEATAEVYTPLDDERVIVEGRIRWIDEDRVIRDDPVVWALEFRDGLLLRFVAARTTLDAEAILGVAR